MEATAFNALCKLAYKAINGILYIKNNGFSLLSGRCRLVGTTVSTSLFRAAEGN